jgi:ergothioneine biosynthesis protein EgtB
MDMHAVRRPRARPQWAAPDDSPAQRVPPQPEQPLQQRLSLVRAASLRLAQGLSPEDQCLQSMPEASPVKWHLAHTTWFFETLVLQPHDPDYRPFNPRFAQLFNSYYEALGPRVERARRGLLSRPGCEEVLRYRRHVDEAMDRLLGRGGGEAAAALVELGMHHEQQHQELMLTDIKHALYLNPLRPAYRDGEAAAAAAPPPPGLAPPDWIRQPAGTCAIGHAGAGFAYDNEMPRHRALLGAFELASRPVTCAQYLQFVLDGGYRRAQLWLSDGWAAVQQHGWQAPLYWEAQGGGRFEVFTLHGMMPLNPAEPVCHVSFYEACAYAAWAGARLPTEFEWEAAAARCPDAPPQTGAVRLHPEPAAPGAAHRLDALFGSVWQWTRSSYDPYPGFRPYAGAAGEYNGKFMVGQLVLRGSSCATPPGHARITYRNFFAPAARWQVSGLRLARDA